MGRLAGKVAIITGGSSGIGAACARLFAAEGARVVVADRAAPSDPKLVAAMDAAPNSFRYIATDVTDEAQIAAAVALAEGTWGQLDATVACAGVSGEGGAVDLSADQWDHVLAVNGKGVFLLGKHAIPAMLRAGGGSLTNISSAYGMIGAPGFAAYCASKGAVRLLTKATAVEFAAQGIRCNSVHPGVIDTPMLQQMFDRSDDPAEMRRIIEGQQPNLRTGKPDDIAWGCVYLASDEAAFVNGAELSIDGGIVAG
ncbi:MAG: glucose 1-dehydrogenase [Pseudomonadota bacterium]